MAYQPGWISWPAVAVLLLAIRTVDPSALLSRPHVVHQGIAVAGQPYALHCMEFNEPMASPELSYMWFKGTTVVQEQPSPLLRFPRLKRTDGGKYACRVSDGDPWTTSMESKTFSLHVLFSPEVHIETPTGKPVIKAVLGESLTLTCVVTAAFPPVFTDSFSWSYSPLPEGPRRPLAGKASTLTLGPLTREDSGQYFCQAWNDEDFKGKIPPGNASVTVDVVSSPPSRTVSTVPTGHAEEGETATLSFAIPKDVMVVLEHPRGKEILTLVPRCIVHLTREFNHRVGHIHCDHSPQTLAMALRNVSEEDTGEYICREGTMKGPEIPDCRFKLVIRGRTEIIPGALATENKTMSSAFILIPLAIAAGLAVLAVIFFLGIYPRVQYAGIRIIFLLKNGEQCQERIRMCSNESTKNCYTAGDH